MEQEGRVGSRAGPQTSAYLLPPSGLTHIVRSLRDRLDTEGAGVLLRQHELHEGLPTHHTAFLQRYGVVVPSVLARIWIFSKKGVIKKIRELFAKERSYPSTTKLHDKARKQVRNLYITCTEYTKKNIVPL